ncbi:MAG: tetratricopeptide repeat protein [Alphaproteobacteria bacterium]|nr:tetratricopeptide repeat protein [Alphaproteobacteria bacterium]
MIKRALAGLGSLAIIAVLTVHALASSLPSDRRAEKKVRLQNVPYQAEEAVQKKDYDRAIELFTKVIDSGAFTDEPHTMVRLYFGRGGAYHAKGDCTAAVVDYTKATEYANKGDIYYSLAGCHLILQQDALALADLDKAIKIDPDAANYRSARCKLLFNTKDFAGAVPDCEKALTATPNDKDLLIASAQAAEQTGNRPRAAALYRQILTVDPGNTIATEGLARVG